MWALFVYALRAPRGSGSTMAHAANETRKWTRRAPWLWATWTCAVWLCASCKGNVEPSATAPGAHAPPGPTATCPARRKGTLPLPGVAPEQTVLDYWLARFTPEQLDTPLLTPEDVFTYNADVGERPGHDVVSQRDLGVPVDAITLASDVHIRLSQLRADLDQHGFVQRDGQPLAESARAAFSEPLPTLTAGLRVVLQPTALRCGPLDGALYKAPIEPTYDKNACGTLRAQEPVELLAQYPNQMWLARSRYSLGWLAATASLSPQLSSDDAQAWTHSARVVLDHDAKVALSTGATADLPAHTLLPILPSGQVLVASASGIERVAAPNGARPTARAITRRALLEAAFSFADSPYGLGDAGGGRDCSGLLLSVFDSFGLALPRHSGWQAEAGSYAIELSGLPDAEKLKRLDAAASRGVVLLYFPGHIMLYLGRDAHAKPMAFHSLGEYAEPCAGGGETIVDVQHTVVSTLDLGRDSTRRSFLERMTRLVVFGAAPSAELQSALVPRELSPQRPEPNATCSDSTDTRIFVSPAVPLAGETLRLIATTASPLDAVQLRVWDEHGEAPKMDELRLGGPPYSRVARLIEAPAGTYTVVLGTRDKVLACKRVRVRKDPLAPREAQPDAPLWEPRWQWEPDTENLWSAFVERLFDGTADDEETWTNLHSLLRDPNRNLLHDHLGLHEDEALTIEPDCADLPYALRAYFAWKLRLPYAFRGCARGRDGHPPTCGDMHTTLDPRSIPDEVSAFGEFLNRTVRSGVHSGTGRTSPTDSATDLYPVALDRASLTPGTVYADPYGHVMMISKWFPQGSIPGSVYGVLMAAEAQPDGTVGRRRFWQGSFLFDPSTRSVGAGFKHLRPLLYDKPTRTLTALDNDALMKTTTFARFSMQQYEGSRDAFYDRMDALINPQPLAPQERMASLLDALEEAAKRRVLAVDNGEAYMREHPGSIVGMPQGADIFETEGPWEDYATPSRDMRLLIAIDTVLDLPARIERTPERFALPEHTDPKQAADTARADLRRALAVRHIQYARSDGSTQVLNLGDIIARAEALEMAYNPNACAEARWAAPTGSAERSTCRREIPAEQERRMLVYRAWFHTRTRPAREN